jgi:hypothetical protein
MSAAATLRGSVKAPVFGPVFHRGIVLYMYARALWGLTRNLRKPRKPAKCLPTPSLHFCYPGGIGSAAFPAQPS